jgi:hypothetical protein
MYLVIREEGQINAVLGVFSSLAKAQKYASHRMNNIVKTDVMYAEINSFSIYQLEVNRPSSGCPLIGSYEYDEQRGVVVWFENSKEIVRTKDTPTKLAYDLLNKDPIALDIAADVINGRR